jgi:predicted TIM-barrel fold metal-dependent hydrolase
MSRLELEVADPQTFVPMTPPAPGSNRELKFPRREFLSRTAVLLAAGAVPGCSTSHPQSESEPVIDIHQHLGYSGRADDVLIAHQRAMGITKTILLPAGRAVVTSSTHGGFSNGLQAKCLGNEACYQFAKQHKRFFLFGANEVPDLDDAPKEIEKYLKLGAVVIGEQKFGIECDSAEMQRLYQLAAGYRVPILMHWQFKMYNYGFERLYKMLEKYPHTIFIGHAQTWWANIDKSYLDDPTNLYPKGQHIIAGGLTDRYLSDYPNMYGDLSAGSGLNAFTRDEEHTRVFFERHQDKLIYGSDCNDLVGSGNQCQGSQTIAVIRRLSPTKKIERKLLCKNAERVFRIKA